MGNVVKFKYEQLDQLLLDAFMKFGFSEKDSKIIRDVLFVTTKVSKKVQSKLMLNLKLFSKLLYPQLSTVMTAWVN